MKAQEYFDKYFSNEKELTASFGTKCEDMFREFLSEFKTITRQRKVSSITGMLGTVRELNEKWNSVAEKANKHFGIKVVKRNVIWNMCLAEKWEKEYPRKPD